MTRQALSLSLRRLEDELDVQLFTRNNEGVEPTVAGDILYRYTVNANKLWDKTLKELKNVKHSNKIRIAMHIMYYSDKQLRDLKDLCRQLTGLRPELINISESGEGDDLLGKDLADLVITHKPPVDPLLHYIKAMDSETLIIMHEHDPLAKKNRINFSTDLRTREIVFVSRETMNEVEPFLEQQGAECLFLPSDRVLLRESIETDHDLMIIPLQCVDVFLSDNMIARPLDHFPVINGIYLNYRESRPELDALIKYLAEQHVTSLRKAEGIQSV